MTRGDSGRIVLEIDPSDKRILYEALDARGLTLKEWFVRQLRNYIQTELQPSLFAHTDVQQQHRSRQHTKQDKRTNA